MRLTRVTPEDRAQLDRLHAEIGKVRAWLTGFQAAGKAGPPGEDSLRQTQILLREMLNGSK